jgi:hypothetical protein
MTRQHTSENPRRKPVGPLIGKRLAWARLWRTAMRRRRRMGKTDDADLAQRVRLSGEW